MKKGSFVVISLVFVSTLYLALTALPENVRSTTRYVGGPGPDNYTTIQSAIDDSDPGDTIYIFGGFYSEDVKVNKTLNLTGEDKDTTLIMAGGMGNPVEVTADWVNITGFTVSGSISSSRGVYLDSVQNCHITDINASDNQMGIYLYRSGNNIIADNDLSNSNDGIQLYSSDNNTIINNSLSGLSAGIRLYFSNNNTVINNDLSNNYYGIYLWMSNNTVIVNNTISGTYPDIYLRLSVGNTLSNNLMARNGIQIIGDLLEHWNTHSIDTTNTVNGKPVLYWKNVTGGSIPSGAGQVILANCTGVVVKDRNLSNALVGIHLGFSSGNWIDNNTATLNVHYGIRLDHSTNNTIINNSLLGNQVGISLGYSDWNFVADNTASNGRYGITLGWSENNTITHNDFPSNEESIRLEFSHNNTIANNIAANNSLAGLYLWHSERNFIANNTASNNWGGIIINRRGSEYNIMVNNTASLNDMSGIAVTFCSNNTVANNTLISNGYEGVSVDNGFKNVITNNTISNNWENGMGLYDARDSVVTGNTISSNVRGGIYHRESESSTIKNNTMIRRGIYFDGDFLEYWNTHVIDDSNTLNSKTIYYWKNVTGGKIPTGAGEVILANCTDVIVENQDVSNGSVGIQLGFSSRNTIADNTASKNIYNGLYFFSSDNNTISNNTVFSNLLSAVYLELSDNNTLTGNTAMSSFDGMRLWHSDRNNIANNSIISNLMYGILLDDSKDNFVAHNFVYRDNSEGIALYGGHNTIVYNVVSNNRYGITDIGAINWIHHNILVDNTVQAFSFGRNPQWDDGYPSGGNYWSDYDGSDDFSGPNQDEPGSDCIGDTPYVIDADSQDRYPLRFLPRPPTSIQATLSGKDFENVTLSWSLSPDDGVGFMSVTGYEVYRNTTYDSKGSGYGLITSLPRGTSEFVDNLAGEGDPNDYFYQVCAVDLNSNTTCSKDQAAKFSRPLLEGQNLVSIPLIQSDESVETVLQTVGFDKAWMYDSFGQEWKSYVKHKPYFGDLEQLNHTVGFWINVTGSSNLTVAGAVPLVTTIHLKAGWNLVGFPSFNSTYTVGDLKTETGATRVEGFDLLSPPYFLGVLMDVDILEAGHGYWVWVESGTDWAVGVS